LARLGWVLCCETSTAAMASEETGGQDWYEDSGGADSWQDDWQGKEWNGGSSCSRPASRSWKRARDDYPPPEPPHKRRWTREESWKEPAEQNRWNRNSSSSWSDDSSAAKGWGQSWNQSSSHRWSGIQPGDRADIEQWVGCSRVGKPVPGTPIVPCKTPFEGDLANRAYDHGLVEDADWFGKEDLLKVCEEQGTPLGLVIDLVNTSKYYAGYDESDDVEYRKVRIPGRTVPDRDVIEEVFDCIDDFVERRPNHYVAVHCTHGINRTGFLVSAYLMTRANLPQCKQAVSTFETARGEKIDKQYLLEALMSLEQGLY